MHGFEVGKYVPRYAIRNKEVADKEELSCKNITLNNMKNKTTFMTKNRFSKLANQITSGSKLQAAKTFRAKVTTPNRTIQHAEINKRMSMFRSPQPKQLRNMSTRTNLDQQTTMRVSKMEITKQNDSPISKTYVLPKKVAFMTPTQIYDQRREIDEISSVSEDSESSVNSKTVNLEPEDTQRFKFDPGLITV